ncbi:nuclear transport factor 2 family protein [Phaeodactylibacter sp.]|uniref:nuclear transport factor 2 family protein n=1 Tax=Phaeodactylibacter sp. TaxID=1940289 RepID=UPI0025CBFC93|nr:nuclear transport factor 2 family protein [Phaeodactylibacter sp.]MCI4650287.1 nuclear transport factor 2 family protein [Phaeodactylibacter sp.]MCI5093536.1 nuclear transport factor 2 family protein [Phaeodactylibacter sp.]
MQDTAIRAYLDALSRGDLEQLMALFAPKAIIHSPLYGQQPARVFYPALLEDSAASHIELLQIFQSHSPQHAAVNFLYHWTLANGEEVTFDCVDIFRFNEAGKIAELKIIYDASQTRPALERTQNS